MTTDIEAIVQCLRFEARVWREQVGEMPIFDDAADALESLVAERDRALENRKKERSGLVNAINEARADLVAETAAHEDTIAERDRLRDQIRKAHDELTWMAVELGWATDGTLPVAVGHAKEILRVRTAERDAAIKERHARELHHFEEEQKSAELRAIIDEALNLHRPVDNPFYTTPAQVCAHRNCKDDADDQSPWPCPTARILSRATTTEKGTEA